MHISEGVLCAPILIGGALGTAGFTLIGLKKLKYEDIPKVSLLTSAFFVASLIHVPLGPTSVHLILNGLNGILLGWATFPSILIALFLQAILFSFGGLTTLGVNTFNMAFPALLSYLFFKPLLNKNEKKAALAGALSAVLSIGISGIMVALELAFTGESFKPAAKLVLLAHIPVMIIESIISAFVLYFIKKTKPEMLP